MCGSLTPCSCLINMPFSEPARVFEVEGACFLLAPEWQASLTWGSLPDVPTPDACGTNIDHDHMCHFTVVILSPQGTFGRI